MAEVNAVELNQHQGFNQFRVLHKKRCTDG